MHILKEVCYMTTSFHYLYVVSLSHGNTWSDSHVKYTVFISQHLLQPSIIKSGLRLIREKLKDMFIWEKPLYQCSFKGAYLFHRTSCINFCLKSIVEIKSPVKLPSWLENCPSPHFLETPQRRITPRQIPLDVG